MNVIVLICPPYKVSEQMKSLRRYLKTNGIQHSTHTIPDPEGRELVRVRGEKEKFFREYQPNDFFLGPNHDVIDGKMVKLTLGFAREVRYCW